jgi:hypothetical protein
MRRDSFQAFKFESDCSLTSHSTTCESAKKQQLRQQVVSSSSSSSQGHACLKVTSYRAFNAKKRKTNGRLPVLWLLKKTTHLQIKNMHDATSFDTPHTLRRRLFSVSLILMFAPLYASGK